MTIAHVDSSAVECEMKNDGSAAVNERMMLTTEEEDTDNSNNNNKSSRDDTDERKGDDVFYAFCVPNKKRPLPSPMEFIFSRKETAFEFAKKNERARFKKFHSLEKAVQFVNSRAYKHQAQKTQAPSSSPSASGSPTVHKSTKRFSSPSPVEMNNFFRFVLSGQLREVHECVNRNPCFLISDGDTPTVLYKMYRYNALHIAANYGYAEMCSFILKCISNPLFLKRLYGHDSDEQISQRIHHLLDLYLNSPDTLAFETPLHVACKFGFLEVAKILVDYPLCDLTVKDRHERTPIDVVHKYVHNREKKTEFFDALNGAYYLPVIVKPAQGVMVAPCDKVTLSSSEMPPIRALMGPMPRRVVDELFERYKKLVNPKTTDVLRRDGCKGPESVLRTLAKECDISFIEEWPFLNLMIDLSSDHGLRLLDSYLRQRTVIDSFPFYKVKLGITDFKLSDKFLIALLHHGILWENPELTKLIAIMCVLNKDVCFAFHNVSSIVSCAKSCWTELKSAYENELTFKAVVLFVTQQNSPSCKELDDTEMKNVISGSESEPEAHKIDDASSSTLGNVAEVLNVSFLRRDVPSKLDFDVLKAVERADLIPTNEFPFVCAWRHRLLQNVTSSPLK